MGAHFEALDEGIIMAPLDSRYTQVGCNYVSVQVCPPLITEFKDLHQHQLFKTFSDPGMKVPGQDKDWALPTTFKVSSYQGLWKNFGPKSLAIWLAQWVTFEFGAEG